MAKQKDTRSAKLYRVSIGYTDNETDEPNMDARKVVANGALEAAAKVKLGAHEYVGQVELISKIDTK